MNQAQQTPSSPNLRAIRILFNAIIVGTLLFSAIAVLINKTQGPFSKKVSEYQNIFLGISIGIAVVCFVIARRSYNKGTAIAKDSLISLPEKLNKYLAALLMYIALCEGPAVFGFVLFLITGNYFILIITVTMIAAMLTKAPTLKRITDELGLETTTGT